MNGFISYAHEDYKLYLAFRKHLRQIERAFRITFWSDERIETGYHWEDEILTHIQTADLFIPLISPAFFASDYICDQEWPAIEKRHKEAEKALILPVVLEPCLLNLLGAYRQAAPTENRQLKAIARWKPQRDGHNKAIEEITRSLTTFLRRKPLPLGAP